MEVFAAEARKSPDKALTGLVSKLVGDVGEVGADGLVPIIMSTPNEDRAGDRVLDSGWDITSYLQNPVLLWSHDMSIPAIGRMHGVTTGPLRGSMEFLPREVNAFAGMIGEMYRKGFLRAGSVGFGVEEYSILDNGGIEFRRQSLHEFSACNVGMNADCLTAARSAGVEVGLFLPFAEKTLDGDPSAPAWLPERQAMTVYRTLTSRVHAVPAGPSTADIAAVLAEVKGLRSDVARLKAAPAPIAGFGLAEALNTAVPSPRAKWTLTPEKSAALVAQMRRMVDTRIAALTGAVVDE